MTLGPAIKPKPPPERPEWEIDPDDKRFEIQRGTGYRRTRIPVPPWPQLEPDLPLLPPAPDDSGFVPPLIDRE